MSHAPQFPDLDAARKDGEAFGRMVGVATAAEMARVAQDPDQVDAVAVEGADVAMDRAERLANVNANWPIVEAWTKAAAEAFNEEVDRARLLLAVAPAVDLKH